MVRAKWLKRNWRSLLLLSAMTLASLSLSGCGEDNSTNPGGADATPPPGVTMQDSELAVRIDACQELIELYQLVALLQEAETSIAEAERTLIDLKWRDLLAQTKLAGTMCDEVDLISFTYQKPEVEGGRYAFTFLFHVKEAFPEDFPLNVIGYVDKVHLTRLPPNYQKRGYDSWGFFPHPETSAWREEAVVFSDRAYILIKRSALAKDIPYHVKVFFYRVGDDGEWLGVYGTRLDLGWLVDF